jgi:tRNA pseudouridine32 synthase/23S rRNA pseudouridine746 synthase
VVPPRDAAEPCLRALVENALGARAFVVHRIDRETSGVVVMARTAAAHRALNEAFERRAVSKTYRALVDCGPPGDSGAIDVPLVPARRGRMRPARPGERGAASLTRYAARERYETPRGPAALVDFHPETGRQHQIRVHARFAGFPILGDRLYAPRGVQERAPRLMLHAAELRFAHPVTGAECVFRAPDPADFDALRQRLARG